MRWREWAQPPGPTDPQWWIDATRREAGRDEMPITLVTQDDQGDVTGAVGLNEFDLPELHDRSPWIIGMIIAPDHRGRGLGGVLVDAIEAIATTHGQRRLWVATERAAGFYQHCGFTSTETLQVGPDLKHILAKDLRQSPHRAV
jgi:N-acetylglutamate synthase-like GNAT family acetyltransferase